MHGFTYSGHPVGGALGLVNIDIMEREGLVQQAAEGHLAGRLPVGSADSGQHLRLEHAALRQGRVGNQRHAARGDALRTAVDRVVDGLREWSRATAEIASALRVSADRYADADARAARRVG